VGPVDPVGPVGSVGSVGSEEGLEGSGVIVSEIREGEGFARLLFAGEGEVVVSIEPEFSITVEADDNLMQYLETVVEEDILRIRTMEGVDIAPTTAPAYRIGLPEVTEIELSGVGRIDVEAVETGMLNVTLSGVGDIVLESVDVDLLLYDISGVGSVSIEGSADEQRGVVAGQGRYDAADLESRVAMRQASGNGHATVWVIEDLDLDIADNGTVEYYGAPVVSQNTAGLASVTSMGPK
jgi:hypothetical protein